jgi:aminomethyltransferase
MSTSISTPQATVLRDRHVRLGARLIEFAGWSMPVQYDGIMVEHERTRTDATVFDTCHMGRLDIRGAGALDGLSRLLTADLRSMKDGQCRYGFLLREDAGILDDTITYRFDAEHWMVVVNSGTLAKDRAWMRERLPPAVSFEDVSGRLAKLDIQGPRSLERLLAATGLDARDLGYFRFRRFLYAGREAWASRTGYTGEKGVEFYVDARDAGDLWDALLAAGVTPAGLGARDTLRLEAGLPLYGHELSEEITPVEAGMERYAAKAEDFIGRAALLRRWLEGPRRRLTGFRIAGRQSARHGNIVRAGGAEAGCVTSGSFAPTLQCSIGFAFINTEMARPGTPVQVDTGRTTLEAELAAMPLYKSA